MQKETAADLVAFLAVARGAQLYARGGTARRVAIGAEPDDQGPGGAAWHPAAEPDDTQRVADRRPANACSQTVAPRFEEIDAALAAASELREKPAGLIRLTATENAAEAVLWPALRKLLPDYPDIKVEVVIDYGLTDIVAEQVDAGVRFGEIVAKDMIAVPIGPAMRMAVVGSPAYLARHPAPRTPRDLTEHDASTCAFRAKRGIYAWEFERNGRELNVRVDGRLVFNTAALMLKAALDGFGLAYFTEQQVSEASRPAAPWSGC